jgi:hypothetical protein
LVSASSTTDELAGSTVTRSSLPGEGESTVKPR